LLDLTWNFPPSKKVFLVSKKFSIKNELIKRKLSQFSWKLFIFFTVCGLKSLFGKFSLKFEILCFVKIGYFSWIGCYLQNTSLAPNLRDFWLIKGLKIFFKNGSNLATQDNFFNPFSINSSHSYKFLIIPRRDSNNSIFHLPKKFNSKRMPKHLSKFPQNTKVFPYFD
jgi:hypothetical protein